MAIDELKAEFALNMTQCRELAKDPEVTPRQIMAHLRDGLWPFIEAAVDEIEAQADIMDEIVEETGDILQPETAGVFAALIVSAQQWAIPLLKAIGKTNPDVADKLPAFETLCNEAADLLEQITVDPGDEDEDEDDDPDHDDDDEETPDVKH
jgi:hypothetical protein